MSIRAISVKGNERAGANAIEAVVLQEIAGSYFGFFSKTNVFLYPEDEIKSKVSVLPMVQSVWVKRNGLQGIEISIEEKREAARWCAGGGGETDLCYSLDEEGLAFDKTAASSAFVYRNSSSTPAVGHRLLPAAEFKKIQFFTRELGRLGLAPAEVILDGSHYMTVKLVSGGRLIVNAAYDLSAVLSNIHDVLADQKVAPSLPRFLERLDYMKLDSGNKVVYKLKK